MTKKDIDYIKEYLKNDFILRDFIQVFNDKRYIKILFRDKVVTISDNIGFAYLISWWCDGSITASQADALTKMCHQYNDRF